MNNEISLRTNNGEYHPGESVYGAVYLRICRPTEGCGIKITFKGLEHCQCDYDCNGKKSVEKETVLVDFSDITLYSQDECFLFGTYVFPFSFQLPIAITGTTELSGEDDQMSWKVNVSYWIKAWVKGSDAIQETQSVIIYQCPERELKENNAGTAKMSTFEIKRFGLGNKTIHVTVKLAENYKTSGRNSQLRLIITNNTKVIVTGFEIKLKRHLRFTFPKSDCDTENMTSVMRLDGDMVDVMPEGEVHVIRTISGSSDSIMCGFVSGGLDHLQVPLVERKTTGESIELPPSASGKCFKIRYGVDVSVSFSNKHTETLSLVIPGVLAPKNQQWASWKAPDWAFGCETKLSESLFSVAENLLYTEAFSSLPVFQVL